MRNLLIILTVISIWGCEQNPYPSDGELITAPREERRVRLPLSADIPQEISFFEGAENMEKFRVKVPLPGKPIMWIDGLPEGASFDSKNLTLTWKPNFFAGNDPKDPTIKTRLYPITVWLKSSENSIEKISQSVSLVVRDVPRRIEISGNDSAQIFEGESLSYEFEVNNADYPQGPFSILTSDFPSNTKVLKVTGNPNKFKIQFSPDHFHVNSSDRECGYWGKSCKKYIGSITVANPAGHQEVKELEVKVQDVRLGVKVVAPTEIEQGLDVNFQVVAYDLNKEVSPSIRFVSTRPNVGNFSTNTINNSESNSTVFDIKWHDIPPSYNGKSLPISFEACVKDSNANWRNCRRVSTDLTIKIKERKAPEINRSNWKVGDLFYLGFNENKIIGLNVIDLENRQLKPRVEIFPESIRQYVSWSNGKLTMRFSKAGTFQFNVVATSDYNVQSSESFLVEVFPESRSKILFFADSTKDKEVQFYKKTFPNLDLMNPVIQDINTRTISSRETLIIGTSILKDTTINEKIIKAMDFIKNIVIASPILENLPLKYLRELNQDYGVVFYRYNDLSSSEDLEKMHLDGLDIFPVEKIKLSQNASSESDNPLIFNIKSSSRNCRAVLDLMNDLGSQIHKIGIVCNRRSGGRLSLLGTEWADLKPSMIDKQIPEKWMKKMLTISVR